jgi:A/G-specific adenine glycosylase
LQDVNALWAGLGYYRRARMLHAGAKYVVENYNGELPSSTKLLLTIPGIGPYTAGAISSIAFGQCEPLVDGNVIRVIARLRAVAADPKSKQLITFAWYALVCRGR